MPQYWTGVLCNLCTPPGMIVSAPIPGSTALADSVSLRSDHLGDFADSHLNFHKTLAFYKNFRLL